MFGLKQTYRVNGKTFATFITNMPRPDDNVTNFNGT